MVLAQIFRAKCGLTMDSFSYLRKCLKCRCRMGERQADRLIIVCTKGGQEWLKVVRSAA